MLVCNILAALLLLTSAALAAQQGFKTCGECSCGTETCVVVGYEDEEAMCHFEEEWESGGNPQQNYEAMQEACNLAEGYCLLWKQGGSYCPGGN